MKVRASRIVSLRPIGYFADNSPIYQFNTSFPTSGVKSLNDGFDNLDDAEADADRALQKHSSDNFPWGTGEIVGVIEEGGKYYGVVNLYICNS